MPSDPGQPIVRFIRELESCQRRRIPLEQVRAVFARACPDLAELAERRRYLSEFIHQAVDQGVCTLPRSARAREGSGSLPLPAFVVLRKPRSEPSIVIPPGYVWHPLLAFATTERSLRRLECLKSINAWLKQNPDLRTIVPIKERSLEIFGNEKRLDRLRGPNTSLFGGRLTLADIACRVCPLPFPFESGPDTSRGRPILILENHDTWFSFCTWNRATGRFSAIAYAGGGHRKGLAYDEGFLDEILQRCGSTEILYFGDLDPVGLSIAAGAACRRQLHNVSPLLPAVPLYAWLLGHGARRPLSSRQQVIAQDLNWLPLDLRTPVEALFRAGHRIPQEALGTRALNAGAASEI